jgi:uncharacterized membrane protein
VDSAADQGDETHAPSRPITTWVLMFLATVLTLLLPDWTGSGALRPIWLFSVPVLLGIVGAVFALKDGRPWWAAMSALWGFLLIQAVIVATTLISGP